MNKYKNITYFLILVVAFLLPFLVKSIDYRLELFPAIILPAGSHQCNIEDDVTIIQNEIYGIDKNGNEKKLNKATFMGKVHMEYFDYFYKNLFGIKEVKNQHTKTTRLGMQYTINSKISKEDIFETKKWLRKKLREQNYFDSILILKKHRIVVRKDGSYYKDKIIKNDTILNLY